MLSLDFCKVFVASALRLRLIGVASLCGVDVDKNRNSIESPLVKASDACAEEGIMTQYLKERLCNGHAPQRINVTGCYLRETLVSRMMMDRRLVRLISAPTLMGKTVLAYSYAKLVFSFENVLWLDTAHPCILRDLDNGTISDKLHQVMSPQSLVVFEDVPWFGAVRKQRFAAVCEDLLQYGCEVVVTCVPTNDPFADNHQDCLLLTSADLLFSDAEFEEMRSQGFSDYRTRHPKCLLERVPGINDDKKGDSIERFLHAQLEHARSPFEGALTVAVTLLESGSIEELSSVLGVPVLSEDLRISDLRPYVALREFRNRFSAEGFPVGDVIRAFQPFVKRICENLPDSDSDAFLCRIADALVSHRSFDRASKLLMSACGPAARAVWLARNQSVLLESGCAFLAFLIFRSLKRNPASRHPYLQFGNAFAQCQLGNRSVGVDRLLAVARRRDAKMKDRLLSATVAALYSNKEPSKLPLGDSFGSACVQARRESKHASPLLSLWNALLEGDTGLEALEAFSSEADCTQEWLLSAACSLRAARFAYNAAELDEREEELLPSFAERVAKAIEVSAAQAVLEVTLAIVSRELELSDMGEFEHSRQSNVYLAQLETRLRSQRSAYERLCETQASAEQQDAGESGEEKNSTSVAAMVSVPLLEVRVFGGFEVSIDGNRVESEKFTRLKVRALLTLMVLNAGKDLSCDHLASLLWPDSVSHKAKRNFYSIFSMLRRSLITPDGTCPYLTKSQCVCRLDAENLRTDVSDLSEICTRMRFGNVTAAESYDVLEALRQIYRGELLPGESAVPAVEAARAQWRNRVVDSLLSASKNFQAKGDLAAALEYAKQASEYDAHREDCYELLMVLQMTCSQRTAAIETFFQYQKMNAELGLGVSSRIFELYDCIVNDDPLPRFALNREEAFA